MSHVTLAHRAANGFVFVTPGASFQMTSPLIAVQLSDGTDGWSYNFGSVYSLGHPAVLGGMVYLANGHGNPPPFAWGFDTSGNPKWQTVIDAQWEQYWSPLIANGHVYTNCGTYGGLGSFDAQTGTKAFFNGTLEQIDRWSPAFFNGVVYTFLNGNFRAHDASTGTTLWTVSVNWQNFGQMDTAPVFGASFAYVISPPSLIAIDPAQKKVAWTANGSYSGTPAVANGTVYGTSGGSLIARDASSGSLSWTFLGDGALSYPPVISNGVVYVASKANVYGVDASTHKQVFTAAVGGWLAVASRRLLVACDDGVLHAFLMSK